MVATQACPDREEAHQALQPVRFSTRRRSTHPPPQTISTPSIILAAGGFIMNKPMTSSHIPHSNTAKTIPLGTSGDDGSGIRLGQSVGGQVSHMDRWSAWRFLSPPSALLQGIVVSPTTGGRIAAEDLYGATFSEKMIGDFQGRGWLILDAKQWREAKGEIKEQTGNPMEWVVRYNMYWGYKKAGTLEQLAGKMGVERKHVIARIGETVGEYNEAIEQTPTAFLPAAYNPLMLPPISSAKIGRASCRERV